MAFSERGQVSDDPHLQPAGPAQPDEASAPHVLPPGFSSFVGRQEEIKEVAALLECRRLVTLTGPTGVGKSRLAIHVASTAAKEHSDGAWLVELAAVADPDLVPAAVAGALGIQEEPGRPLPASLADRLRSRCLLLVLDNCEHLLGASALLAHSLVAECPRLTVLATSQHALGIAGELVWRVPPMSIGDGSEIGSEALALDAVRLFAERAGAANSGFALTTDVVPAVVEVCRRLDGNPLAIELAAARVGVLAPDQISQRLDRRFELLTVGPTTAPERHRTLEAAIDWSYGLLEPKEQMLLQRLSVFRGTFGLEAAEDVGSGSVIGRTEVVDLLAALITKSLLVSDLSGARPRYWLRETLREYAADRLAEAGESSRTLADHAAWYTRLAEQAEAQMATPHHRDWGETLDREHDNLRAALDWALSEAEEDIALRLTAALVPFWRMRGSFREGRERLERALALDPDASPVLRTRVVWGAGFLATLAGDYRAALHHGESSLALSCETQNPTGTARSLYLVGLARTFYDDPRSASSDLDDAAEIARASGDTWCEAGALAAKGRAHMFLGDPSAARPCFEACLDVAVRAGDSQSRANALIGLGWISLSEGAYGEAQRLLEAALGAAREIGDSFATAMAVNLLGDLGRRRGDYREAEALLEEGLALGRRVGSPLPMATSLGSLGRTARDEGDTASAAALLEEASAVAEGAGLRVGATARLKGLGEVANAAGDTVTAKVRFEESLCAARVSGDAAAQAEALYQLGQLARGEDDYRSAVSLHHDALALRRQMMDLPGLTHSLEAVAGLAAARGSADRAARLFGAAQALRDANGYARAPADHARYAADLAITRVVLDDEEFDGEWRAGGGLTADEAASYASRGRGRGRPREGWASLTPAERDVVDLVAQGLTNAEVGTRMFISRRTVQNHLSHVFAKLGLSSRRELAREAAARRSR